MEPGLVLDALGYPSTDPAVMFPGTRPGETAGATSSDSGSGSGSERCGSAPKPKMGALVAAAAHKGYGLGLLCELFAAVATGGDTVAPSQRDREASNAAGVSPAVLNSMFTLIFDPVATSGKRVAGGEGEQEAAEALEALYEEVVVLTDFVKSSPSCPIAAHPNGASSPSGCSDPLQTLPTAAAPHGAGILVPGERARENRRRRRDQVAIDGGTWKGLRAAAVSLGLDESALFDDGDNGV